MEDTFTPYSKATTNATGMKKSMSNYNYKLVKKLEPLLCQKSQWQLCPILTIGTFIPLITALI